MVLFIFFISIMLVYLLFGIFVYRLSPGEAVNKIVLIFGLFIFFWFFLFLAFVRKELWGSSDFAWHYILYGIPMMCVLFFHFSLLLIHKFQKRKPALIILYLPAVSFALYGILKVLINSFPGLNKHFFSNFLDLDNPAVYIIMGLTGFFIIESALVLIALWGLRSRIVRERKQALFFSSGFSICFVINLAAYLLYQLYRDDIFLIIYLTIILILALLFWIGVIRYRLLVPTPFLAVQGIMNSIGEIVFLMDRNMKIQSVNLRMKEFLSQPESGIIGHNISDFAILEPDDAEKIRNMLNSGINSLSCRIRFKNDGEALFPQAEFSSIRDQFGDTIGVLSIVKENNGRKQFLQAFNITGREMEVLDGVLQGKTLRITASELGITERTAETHIQNIHNKTGTKNKVDLIKLAYTFHLIHQK